MLKLCFISPNDVDFNVETPFLQPLGGSESGLCYLAIELSRQGHEVFLLGRNSAPGEYRGVTCLSLADTSGDFFAQRNFHAAIVLNVVGHAAEVKQYLPPATKLVLWTGNDADTPIMTALRDPTAHALWDYVVTVSDWHRLRCLSQLHLHPESTVVLRNAIAPCFENLFREQSEVEKAKSGPPVLAYTSLADRGLNVLLGGFAQLRKRYPQCSLHVYGGRKIYQQKDTDFEQTLYRLCRETAGIKTVGALPQPELARELRRIQVLTYPAIVAETSCIGVMEAMASGCQIVASEYGGLPETTAGYARLVPVAFKTIDGFAYDYLQTLADLVELFSAGHDAVFAHLWAQVNYVNRHYTWSARAREWADWLAAIAGE